MLKAFKWLPFTLTFLVIDYWNLALRGVIASTAISGVYSAFTNGKWLSSALIGGGIAIAVIMVLWLSAALILAYRDRNKIWRMM